MIGAITIAAILGAGLPFAMEDGRVTAPGTPVPIEIRLDASDGMPEEMEVFLLEWPRARSGLFRLVASQRTATFGGRVRVGFEGGRRVLLVLRRPGDPAYAVDGPFTWPREETSRPAFVRWRRTVSMALPPQFTPEADPIWLEGNPDPAPDGWPECQFAGGNRPECIGVPLESGGLMLLQGRERLAYAVVPAVGGPAARERVVTRLASFGRLLRIAGPEGSKTDDIEVRVVREKSGGVGGPLRVALEAEDGFRISRIGEHSFWIAGSDDVSDLLLRIQGEAMATETIPLSNLEGPAAVPFDLPMREPLTIEGRVVDARGAAVPGTPVSVRELLPPLSPSAGGRRAPGERHRSLKEVITGEAGVFLVRGLEDRSYELLAIHPTFGRVRVRARPGVEALTLRLKPPRRAQGRVVRDGTPVPSVPVLVLPEPAEMAQEVREAGVDPTDFLSPGVTSTDSGGRFSVGLPPRGAGQLRIGSEQTGFVRLAYRIDASAVDDLDYGQVELPRAVRLEVDLEGPVTCGVTAAGPVGSTGLSLIEGTPLAGGRRLLLLPEAGRWFLSASCGRATVDVVPPLVDVPLDATAWSARVTVQSPAP